MAARIGAAPSDRTNMRRRQLTTFLGLMPVLLLTGCISAEDDPDDWPMPAYVSSAVEPSWITGELTEQSLLTREDLPDDEIAAPFDPDYRDFNGDHFHSYCGAAIPSDAVSLATSGMAAWRLGADASGLFVVHGQYRYSAPIAPFALDELRYLVQECGDYKVELISKAPRNGWAAMRSCGEFEVAQAASQVTTFGFCEDTLDSSANSDVLLNVYLAAGSWVSYLQIGAPSRSEADALLAVLLLELSAEFVDELSS